METPNIEKKAWIFSGRNEVGELIHLYVSEKDRESAIAKFETSYPQYKWYATTECDFLNL